MRVILNNHPEIAIPDETAFANWLFFRPGIAKLVSGKASKWPSLVSALGSEIVREFDALPWFKRPRTAAKKLNWLMTRYVEKEGKRFWGEKTPLHAFFIGDILRMFPHCTVIFMMRDPRAVIASFLRYRNDKMREDGDFWMADDLYDAIEKYKKYILPLDKYYDFVKIVRYEDLVSYPSKIIKEICEETLHLSVAQGMLHIQIQTNKSPVFSEVGTLRNGEFPVWKKDILGGIKENLMYRWKSEFSDREVNIITRELNDYILRFGYK